jgi:hypothetical protein
MPRNQILEKRLGAFGVVVKDHEIVKVNISSCVGSNLDSDVVTDLSATLEARTLLDGRDFDRDTRGRE